MVLVFFFKATSVILMYSQGQHHRCGPYKLLRFWISFWKKWEATGTLSTEARMMGVRFQQELSLLFEV